MKSIALAFAFAVTFAGCVIRPLYLAPSFAPPKSAAVLPVSGASEFPRDAEYVRRVLIDQLRRRGYPGPDSEKTDSALAAKLGGSDADRVKAASAETLRAALPDADAAVYAEFLEHRYQQTGMYLDKKVRLKFTMVDLKTGEKLWEHECQEEDNQVTRNDDAMREGLAPNWFGRGYLPLERVMFAATARAVKSLPETKAKPAKKGLLW
jgi:hypothetical protein